MATEYGGSTGPAPQQYRWLMEGLKTEQPKANKVVSGLSVI